MARGKDEDFQGADVFISYQRDNAAHARRLAEALRRDNRQVWLDQRLGSDSKWRGEIETKLRRARCVVAIWSKKASTSGWVNYEAFRAQQEGKLVAVTFDPIKSEELPEWLSDQQITSLRDWKNNERQIHDGWLGVRRVVSAKCNQLPEYKFKGWLGGGPVHERVTSLSFHPAEDSRLVSCGSEGVAASWLASMASADGRGTYDSDGNPVRLDAAKQGCEARVEAPSSGNEYYKTSIWRSQHSPDGDRIVLSCRDGRARVYDWSMTKLLFELPHNEKCGVMEMGFAKKSGGQHKDGVWDACILADGDIVTVGGSRVATWTPDGQLRHAHPMQLRPGAQAMAVRVVAPDVLEGGVIIADKMGKVRVIDPKTQEDAFQIDDRWDTVVHLALGPSFAGGKKHQGVLAIVSESPLDSEIRFHDWAVEAFSKPRPTKLQEDAPPIRSMALHPRAPVIAIGSSAVQPRLHDYGVDEAIPLPRDGRHDRGITAVAFSASGRFLAAGSEDGRISVWEDRSQPF
ncbi:MAG: TIR domain-containing protein [Proteobacteria bacterium]|nr:TIR domain-containing protein [Pseudomonadota bacterium]